MKRLFLLAFIFSTFSSLLQAAENAGQIYRWVDKDGTEHYADKPNSKTAVLVDIRETSSNSVIESNVKMPELAVKKESPELSTKGLSAEDITYCKYIIDQINLAKEAIETGSELKADYARAYVESSDRLLRDNNCI